MFGYLGYQSLKNTKQPSVKVSALIPDSCSVLLLFDNYPEFTNSLRNKSLIWQDVRLLSHLKPFDKYLAYFDSVLANNNDFKELAENNPIYLSVYPGNKFLIALNLKELSDEKRFKEKLSLFTNAPALIKTSLQDGVLGISNDESVLANLFNAAGSKLINNKNFAILNEAADYPGVSIYVNSPGLLCKTFSGLTVSPESIAFNGISLPDSNEFKGDIYSAPLNSFELLEHVPIVSNAFRVFAIGDAEKLFSKVGQKDWWKEVNSAALFNAKKQFYDNISEYMITVSLPSKNKALVVHLKDSVKLAEVLPYMEDTSLTHGDIHHLISSKQSFNTSTFENVKLSEFHHFVVLRDHIIFTVTESDAEIFINAKLINTSILQDKAFGSYAAKNFDVEYHYLEYFLASSLTKEQLPYNEWLENDDIYLLKNISHCSFLSSFKKGLTTYRFHVKYFQEDILDEPNVLWTMNTDSTVITRPFPFKNHITGGNEIVFQSQNNALQLLNATGKIIWKKYLSEQIRSEIYTVDAFKNGRFQMLFSSDHYLHLLDRNGNYVQGYPVRLPAKATNKLCVFDYEGKNDLRLFIACADNRIYNYSIWGIKNAGFKPHVTSSEVNLPVRYCKVGLSDYLVTADRKGKLYAFSRKGDGRIDFKNKLLEDVADIELQEGSSLNNTQIIYYDEKNGLINKISLGDKKEIFKTSEAETSIAYSFGDFDKNKITDILLATTGKFEAYDINGTRIYTTRKPDFLTPFAVQFHSLNNISFITVFDKVNSKITMCSQESLSNKEFSATQPALAYDLFNDGKPYMLVVSGKKIKCYKL